MQQVLRVSARESHAVIGFFEGLDGVKQRGAQNPSSNIDTLDKYPKWRTETLPALYNKVNGSDNMGGTTLKFIFFRAAYKNTFTANRIPGN